MSTTACGSCGVESSEGFRFCPACGAELAAATPERRRPATLLFCDMSGSTAMGERVDAESVRELMFRYFHTMRGAIERHGGTVEKFVGDAVMAVFGVPRAHEDDPLRAVKAAWEMQERASELNLELERRLGVTIALRIGVNTGEVVAGDSSSRQTIVTGDAVNTAARLEQAATPGQILLGESTWRLVRDTVHAEPVESIAAKGKAEPVAAYRLLAVTDAADRQARRPDAELVGRERELARLQDTWHETVATRRCRLVTLVGEPGVGKSRLARELAARFPRARTLSGRCLSYGEGITWWPVGEIVREAAGIRDDDAPEQARERIVGRLGGDEQASAALAQALGLSDRAAGVEEIGWAFRRLLSAVAREAPTLVVVDDVQWAEEALLELLEALPSLGPHEPVLCLCLARPELLERRSDWPGVLALEPLVAADAAEHAGKLVAREGLAEDMTERVLRAAGGNPLFAEEIVAMLRDDPGARLPASLSGLLADRLDRLGETERRALECGAVEGEIFHRGAAAMLAERDLDMELEALREKAFVRPARASFLDEAAYRFRHLLIRDAAYNATAKRSRAVLHERFADWLERIAGDRALEVQEIVGYHLEQAHRYLEELGPVDRPDLAARAAEKLASAGRRAAARGDAAAASNLLTRATAFLPPDDPIGIELRLELAIALSKRGDESVGDLLTELEAGARRRGDRRLSTLVGLESRYVDLLYGRLAPGALFEAASAAAEQLAALGDDRWQAHALARATASLVQQDRLAEAVEIGRRAVELARSEGDERVGAEALEWLTIALTAGPTPLAEVEAFARAILSRPELRPSLEWLALLTLALARGPAGHVDEARALVARARAIADELGLQLNAACTSMQLAQIELLGRDVRDAESELRKAVATLAGLRADNPLASVSAYLALVLCARGEFDEADELVETSVKASSPEDFEARILALGAARARILSARGAHAEADAAMHGALPSGDGGGQIFVATVALEAHGDVLRAAGRHDEARVAYEQAVRLHEQKGNLVAAADLRDVIGTFPPGRLDEGA